MMTSLPSKGMGNTMGRVFFLLVVLLYTIAASTVDQLHSQGPNKANIIDRASRSLALTTINYY